jgi:hypothetical protein
MSGHHPFSALRKRRTPARQAHNAQATRRVLAEIASHELPTARERPEEEFAGVLKGGQPAVTKPQRPAQKR